MQSLREVRPKEAAGVAEVARAAQAAGASHAPAPRAAALVLDGGGREVTRAVQGPPGTPTCEALAAAAAGAALRGSTVLLNLEPLPEAASELARGGARRVIIGARNPLTHLSGLGVQRLLDRGVDAVVLGDVASGRDRLDVKNAIKQSLDANEALFHRAATGRPFSILKYAMTLDGKIAASTGHSAWVSSPASRQRVYEARAESNAVIVGGNTVREDDPKLTTRRADGNQPVRIVMSRTLDLPEEAALWDTGVAPTIVMTQRGTRADFQARLRAKGVEVVEFTFVTPEAVADYCYQRGFLQLFWECGGGLAAPAIAAGVIHKCMAFIAPKIIGGVFAPSPVGELGFVEMTQAVQLVEPAYEAVGQDLFVTGYLPSSGGLWELHDRLQKPQAPGPALEEVEFYKTWDPFGDLSNFSPHAVTLPIEGREAEGEREWRTVESFYQAHKYACVDAPEARALVEEIWRAESPEDAAKVGRRAQKADPGLVRPDWDAAKLEVMERALEAKFRRHAKPRQILLSTCAANAYCEIIEASPHDYFWGVGLDRTGKNWLGVLLMAVRDRLAQDASSSR